MYKTIHTLIAVAMITEVSGRGVSHPVLEVKCDLLRARVTAEKDSVVFRSASVTRES